MLFFVLFIPFFVFGTCNFWQQSYKNMKILCNLCLHFARQDEKRQKKDHPTKVTRIPKTIRQKYGMNETLVNIVFIVFIYNKGIFIRQLFKLWWAFEAKAFSLLLIDSFYLFNKFLRVHTTNTYTQKSLFHWIHFSELSISK